MCFVGEGGRLVFSYYFLKYSFCPFSPLLWYSHYAYVGILPVVPRVSQTSFTFFYSFFSLLFLGLDNINWSILILMHANSSDFSNFLFSTPFIYFIWSFKTNYITLLIFLFGETFSYFNFMGMASFSSLDILWIADSSLCVVNPSPGLSQRHFLLIFLFCMSPIYLFLCLFYHFYCFWKLRCN